MKILAAFDSYFINTKMVADAVVEGFEQNGAEVLMERIYQVNFSKLSEFDLVVFGAPTHNQNMPQPVKSVLKRLPKGCLEGKLTLCFDTRYKINVVKSGSAALRIDRLLKKFGGQPITRPESFFVQERRGPLFPGELERARQWAASILIKHV